MHLRHAFLPACLVIAFCSHSVLLAQKGSEPPKRAKPEPKTADDFWLRSWDFVVDDPDKALAYIDEAIRMAPSQPHYYTTRATIRYKFRNAEFGKALIDFDEAIHLGSPDDPYAIEARADFWKDLGVYDKAVADYTEAIRRGAVYRKGGETSALGNRARLWTRRGDYDKALADYGLLIRTKPWYSDYSSRAWIWVAKKEYDLAVADFSEAIKLETTDASLYFDRAYIQMKQGQYDKALADYNEAIRLSPKFTAVYAERAWLWATCPDPKYRNGVNAVRSAKTACELRNWKNANEISILAAAYAETGDYEEAVKYQAKALEIASENRRAAYRYRLELYQAKRAYRDLSADPVIALLGAPGSIPHVPPLSTVDKPPKGLKYEVVKTLTKESAK